MPPPRNATAGAGLPSTRPLAETIPHSFELVDTYVARGGYDPTDEFLFGLDLILDGLERLLDRTNGPEGI